MVLYDLAGNDWKRFGAYCPNLKSGDIFYTIYNNKIISIRIKSSYMKFIDTDYLKICATFETPLKNTIFDSEGCIYRDYSKIINIYINNKSYPVYKTVEDAKNNIRFNEMLNISKYNIINRRYFYAQLSRHYGDGYDIYVYTWTYDLKTLIPEQSKKAGNSLIWFGSNLLIAKDGVKIPDAKWSSKEEVLEYISELNKNLEVVSFNENESKPEVKIFNLNIEVSTNMSLDEIVDLVSTKLSKLEK